MKTKLILSLSLFCFAAHAQAGWDFRGGIVKIEQSGNQDDLLLPETAEWKTTNNVFEFYETTYGYYYTFNVLGNQLIDAVGNVAGTVSSSGFQFSAVDEYGCNDTYTSTIEGNQMSYNNSYTCPDSSYVITKGTIALYSDPGSFSSAHAQSKTVFPTPNSKPKVVKYHLNLATLQNQCG